VVMRCVLGKIRHTGKIGQSLIPTLIPTGCPNGFQRFGWLSFLAVIAFRSPSNGVCLPTPIPPSPPGRVWKQLIKRTRDLIRRCELSRANPEEAFRQFGKKGRRLFGVELSLSIKSSKSPVTLEIRPETLIAAIELQAVQSIVFEGRQSQQCIECSKWFPVGIGARRSQSKFCSMRCKDNYHNRLKAQARRMVHA
jgi:hypothetical protein